MHEILTPSNALVQTAALRALHGKVKEPDLNKFMDLEAAVGVPAPIRATGSLWATVIYSGMKCEPVNVPYYFEEGGWGLGLGIVTTGGILYTAYETWDAFWRETAGYHAQGISEGGGILQFNFFNSSGVPVGQFNGVAGGIGAFEFGGTGKWKKK
jgi:hypothetical protein